LSRFIAIELGHVLDFDGDAAFRIDLCGAEL
jgi:hypothetical protein